MLALVTGGTKGVGREIVSMLVEKKIPTIYTGRNIIDDFSSQYAIGKKLELNDYNSIHSFLTEIKSENLKPNIIIHNAGVLSVKQKETPKKIQQMFMANAIGPLLLTQELLPFIERGHILFNAPPYKIDDKVKFLTPYMQSKLSQTTYMKSIAHIVGEKPISVNSFWTHYPLWTDALRMRKIGTKENCMHPKILAKVVENVIFHENPETFKGNELVDREYLKSKNIPLLPFELGSDIQHLDSLFLSYLVNK